MPQTGLVKPSAIAVLLVTLVAVLRSAPSIAEGQTAAAITVSGRSLPMLPAEQVQFSVIVTNPDGSTRLVAAEATWSSSNKRVATVTDQGVVAAVAPGHTEITASYGGRIGTFEVVVAAISGAPTARIGAACGVERWRVKTLSDVDADRLDLSRPEISTIKRLNELPSHCNGGPDRRTYPEEFRVYEVLGRVVAVRPESDRDFHLILADPRDPAMTLVAEIPDPACEGAATSRFSNVLEEVRMRFIRLLPRAGMYALKGTVLRVRGVGYFDFAHGQTGRAKNCLELHPVVAIDRVLP